MSAQRDNVLNTIRGKNLVGKATKDDILKLFEHIDALEMALEQVDMGEHFGTGGWRDHLGIGD
jgi:hypothetical protein